MYAGCCDIGITIMSIRCNSIGIKYHRHWPNASSKSSNCWVTRSPISQMQNVITNDQAIEMTGITKSISMMIPFDFERRLNQKIHIGKGSTKHRERSYHLRHSCEQRSWNAQQRVCKCDQKYKFSGCIEFADKSEPKKKHFLETKETNCDLNLFERSLTLLPPNKAALYYRNIPSISIHFGPLFWWFDSTWPNHLRYHLRRKWPANMNRLQKRLARGQRKASNRMIL